MIMDKNGKLFGKISVVDIAVILIVVVGVCGIFYTKSKLDSGKVLNDASQTLIQSSSETDMLEVELKLVGVRDITKDAIIVGDEVYLTATEKVLGSIVRVESKPHFKNVTTNDGTVYNAEVPEKFDVSIIVHTGGIKREDGYFTDTNFHLYYGKSMEIKTSTIQTTPEVSRITVLENTK